MRDAQHRKIGNPVMSNWRRTFFYRGTSGLSGLPGLCNLSVSTALGKADSIKIKVVEVRRRATGASLIIGIGSSTFVFLSLSLWITHWNANTLAEASSFKTQIPSKCSWIFHRNHQSNAPKHIKWMHMQHSVIDRQVETPWWPAWLYVGGPSFVYFSHL